MSFPLLFMPPSGAAIVPADEPLTINGNTLTIEGQTLTLGLLQSPGIYETAIREALGLLLTFRGVLCRNVTTLTGINASVSDYAIPWAKHEFDTDGFHSTTTNTERVTIPIGSGITKVRLRAWAYGINVVALSNNNLAFWKNGSATFNGAGQMTEQNRNFTEFCLAIESGILDVVEGDYFDVRVYSSDTAIDLWAFAGGFELEVIE
jgi:hypothetical protein